jgi:hypothetical protein
MDASLCLDGDGELWIREGRRVRQGDRVAVGKAEDGSEGIFVQSMTHDADNEFKFMTSEVSREKPIDYSLMAELLIDERDRAVATALHAIATGNMLPAFVTEKDGTLRELATICVDSSEFVVSKLKDRGTHQAFGVVTNAQDFMHILRLYVEREITARAAKAG